MNDFGLIIIVISFVILCTLLRTNYLLEEIHADLEEKDGESTNENHVHRN